MAFKLDAYSISDKDTTQQHNRLLEQVTDALNTLLNGVITIDEANKRVGVNQPVPAVTFEIGNDTAGATTKLRISSLYVDIVQNQIMGQVEFYSADESTSNQLVVAAICAVAEGLFNANNHQTGLAFYVATGSAAILEKMRLDSTGRLGIGITAPFAVLHLKAGTAAAGTAPLKLTSGAVMTTPEAGAMEFLTDDIYATITTGLARKAFILDDGARLTSGKIPKATTNGRLIDLVGQDHETDLKVDYTAGDLDTEAEIITAINATNTKINAILTKLETLGLFKTS